MTKNNTKNGFANLPLIALTITVSFALEAFGWGYIWLVNTESVRILSVQVPMALVESTIISATGLMALIAAFVAAERRNDPRPEQRRLAWGAQVLAVALIVPPVFKAADAFAYPAQIAEAATFSASSEAQAWRDVAADPLADTPSKVQAARELARATRPARAQGGFTWIVCLLGASFLYGVNMAAASLLWRAKPETPAERTRRLDAEEKARRRADRKRKDMIELARIEAEAAKNRPTLPTFIRGIFNGGRKAA